jgi:1-acyl-sn-glycerol-3-phosphate acyltransferase
MKHARAILRLVALAAFTACMYLLNLLTRLSRLCSARLALQAQSAVFRGWARGVAALVGMRIATHGAPPAPPCFIVANHLSYMDIVVLAARARCFFIAKSEVADWPVIGLLTRSMNVIFVQRERHTDLPRVIAAMERAMAAGQSIVFFPEGTSSAGERVSPFKPALFEAAVRSRHPVFSASLSYATPPGQVSARTAVCWWGDMGFVDHFYELLQLPGFRARVEFGRQVAASADRKTLARAAQSAVEAIFAAVPAADTATGTAAQSGEERHSRAD